METDDLMKAQLLDNERIVLDFIYTLHGKLKIIKSTGNALALAQFLIGFDDEN